MGKSGVKLITQSVFDSAMQGIHQLHEYNYIILHTWVPQPPRYAFGLQQAMCKASLMSDNSHIRQFGTNTAR
jgi:hypothetical protein